MPINMGHCRFENTLLALLECRAALDDIGISALSDTEQTAAAQLIALCAELANNHGSNA